MLRNYLLTALRNLRKHKVLALINVLGLAVGLCCGILIFLYVTDEISFDNFHAREASVFRVMTGFYEKDGSLRDRGPAVPIAAAPLLKDYLPEIRYIIRFAAEMGTVMAGDRLDNEQITFTDEPVFRVFSFPLLRGDPASVLADESSMVLTETAARKYFGEKDPVGSRLTVGFGDRKKDFMVTGVARDVPRNSTVQFKILARIENLALASYPEVMTNLGDFSFPLFIELSTDVRPQAVESRFEAFISQAFAATFKRWGAEATSAGRKNPIFFELQRLRDMHFDTRSFEGTNPAGVILLAAVGLIVLLIAGINFINLSVGRAASRAKEVAMRKTIGATRREVLRQFWMESFLMTGLAFLLGIILALLFSPTFGVLSGKRLLPADFIRPLNVAAMGGLLLFVAAASGGYPALVMARVQPVQIFRRTFGLGGRRGPAKVLVIIQFGLSVFLIVTTLLLGKQIRFMTEKDTGYPKEGLIAVDTQSLTDQESRTVIDRLKAKLIAHPGIISIGASSLTFGKGTSRCPLEKEGQRFSVYQFRVDPDYIPTIGLRITAGRNFDWGRAADTKAVIINEQLRKRLGVDDPVGHRIGEFVSGPSEEYPNRLLIIGVVADYNNLSFKHAVQPLVLHMQPNWGLGEMIVRVGSSGVADTLKVMEKAWRDVRPDKPFLYSFVADDLESQYKVEKRWNGIVRYSSLFALAIACLGVFGLTTLAVARRVKEVGIRKVLGAGAVRIFSLISGEFLILVGAANLAAWPAAYYVMRKVLEGYHYRIAIGPEIFLLAGAATVALTLLTIGWLAGKAALADPVRAIRYE